jgi:hypothetical protein
MNEKTIARRGVFFIGGYDPKTPGAFFDRLMREIARFEKTWDASVQPSPVEVSGDGESGRMTIRTSAQDWAVETDFNFFVLDKIVLGDFARPLPVRLWKYLVTLADYVGSGTFLRMARASWRFTLYFLYPFVLLVLFAIAAWLVAGWIKEIALPANAFVQPLIGLALFFALLATLGERWPVTHLMDLWSFSRNYLRGRRPDADAFLERCGKMVVSEARRREFDEILLVGHSTGGALALDIAAEALKADPALTARGAKVCVLTLGSTALKVGLHPAGGPFRRKVQALVDDGRLDWLEVQCLTDVINFYKCDPVAIMKLRPRAAGQPFPMIWQVRVRDMLDPAVYKRVKRNFFRVHYQYIYGNTKRYFYDFFMICCGPLPLRIRAETKVAGPGTTRESTS